MISVELACSNATELMQCKLISYSFLNWESGVLSIIRCWLKQQKAAYPKVKHAQ
jgi:hypothetical protein